MILGSRSIRTTGSVDELEGRDGAMHMHSLSACTRLDSSSHVKRLMDGEWSGIAQPSLDFRQQDSAPKKEKKNER